MNNTDLCQPIGTILDVHQMICDFIVAAVEDIPESRMTEQPGPIVNHPAWMLSHLNGYAGLLLATLGDHSVPTADAELERCGYGTKPVPNAALYASKHELLAQFKARNARLRSVVLEKHAEYFPKPAPARFQPHSPTIAHIAITLLVAHPPDHLGQLRLWRRLAGIPSPG